MCGADFVFCSLVCGLEAVALNSPYQAARHLPPRLGRPNKPLVKFNWLLVSIMEIATQLSCDRDWGLQESGDVRRGGLRAPGLQRLLCVLLRLALDPAAAALSADIQVHTAWHSS